MATNERTQISLRVPSETLDALEKIAGALDRDRTWVMLQAFQYYLDREGGDILIDAAGLASVGRGETVDWDSAKERIEAAIARGAAAHIKKAG